MDLHTVKELGFWGAISVGTGGLLFGIAKSISDATVEIYKKRNESSIKIAEHNALNDSKHLVIMQEKEIQNLHEQNKMLHDSIEELKLMQDTMREQYEAQIEELRTQIGRLSSASHSRVADVDTLRSSRFFLKLEQKF
jgi:predicted RNase H-like nuclease (RuvC/YqgF family)